ncbi:MAG: hypothetical protein K6U88_06955 [Dehalococcoidia bacterium]|nr:hypothetical protein [Dehalococcoidia bacterium]
MNRRQVLALEDVLVDQVDVARWGRAAEALLPALAACIPNEYATRLTPVVSLTGYEGELEVRDFLRRAQRDLVAARNHEPGARIAAAVRARPQHPAPAENSRSAVA